MGYTDTLPELDTIAAQAALLRGVLLIDVREPDEYADDHLAEAQLWPLSQWTVNPMSGQLEAGFPSAEQLAQAKAASDAGTPVLIICRSGKRSAAATLWLQQQGITQAANVSGGMLGWRETEGLC